jgi:polar amino acid transport system substrate-binding protein
VFLGLLKFPACDDFRFPRDPDGTLERVLASGRMRVVAVDHVPWVVVERDGSPVGSEVELIEAFARSVGATIEWRRAPAFKALEALGRRDADLAIGGFTRRAVTAHQAAGHSYAYFTEALIVAAEPGTPLPRDLRGQRVHAAPALLANGLVEDRGGVPVAERTEAVRLVAMPDWQLPMRGLVPTDIVLKREEHVIAVPRGENAWVMRLERFLREHAGGTAGRLRAHAP